MPCFPFYYYDLYFDSFSQGESEEKEENGKEYEPSRMLLLFLADL